jgi:hypothetical protein
MILEPYIQYVSDFLKQTPIDPLPLETKNAPLIQLLNFFLNSNNYLGKDNNKMMSHSESED